MNSERSFCSFYCGDALYGVPIDTVLEVRIDHPVVSVPLAPPAVAGVMNIRGRIITALDLRALLRPDQPPEPPGSESLVINACQEDIGLLVDRVGDIHELEPESCHAPPHTLSGPERRYITSVYRLEQELLCVIDAESLVEESLSLSPSGEAC